jgi:cellobiose PTS system EIIB component
MLTITLLCNLGMSTSMLVDKMVKAANAQGLEVNIDALPFDKADDRLKKTDILLLGPQVRYLLKKFQAEFGNKIPVIEAMNMSDYALIKADKILNEALAQYKTNKPRA